MFELKKRGAIWHVEINLRTQRIRRTTGTEDRTLAEEFAAKLYAEVFRQIQVGDRPKWTWADAVTEYLTEDNGRRANDSNKSLLRIVSPYFQDGAMRLEDISGTYLKGVLDTLGENRSTATRNRYAQIIRAILRAAAYRWEDDQGRTWIDKPPHVKVLKENNHRDRWLTRDEVAALFLHLPVHLAEMAAVALYTGLRESNIVGMQWSWVDLDRRVVIIPREESKTGRPIPVYLVSEAYSVIAAIHADERTPRHKTHVFAFRGKPVRHINNSGWRTARAAAGLPDVWVHDLRRTWASWHLQAGTTIDELMKIGGWASPEIVRERYAHLAPEQLQRIAENVRPSLAVVG